MKPGKEKVIINFIVVIITVLFLVLPLLHNKEKEQYDIVFLGDSIIGNVWDEYSIPNIVGERLGKTVFNGAFGGTVMSLDKNAQWGSVTGSHWCMAKLADAIAYKDWQSQAAAMEYADHYSEVNAQALNYFAERMGKLSRIDFDQVKLLIIEHGTNDYNCGRELDNPKDPYDITTFGGALRHSLEVLQSSYPDMQIVLLTPVYCELGGIPCTGLDFGYGTLDAFVELEQQIAEEFGVVCIDAYRESGIGEENFESYLYDGLHPSEEGIALLGDFVADKLVEAGIY